MQNLEIEQIRKNIFNIFLLLAILINISLIVYYLFFNNFNNSTIPYSAILYIFLGLFLLAIIIAILNFSKSYSKYSYHLGILFFYASIWFNYPHNVMVYPIENFYLNPTNMFLMLMIICTLIFSYKEHIIYSLLAIIENGIFYLFIGYSVTLITQKTLTLIIVFICISVSSYFHNEKLENLKIRFINLNNQHNKILTNNEIVNNFIYSATKNLSIPLSNFQKTFIEFENSIWDEKLVTIDPVFLSLNSNFNYINSLIKIINEVNSYSMNEDKNVCELTDIPDLVSELTDRIHLMTSQTSDQIILFVHTDINRHIYCNKIKILEILINLIKCQINQNKTLLTLQFSLEKENSKDFLGIILGDKNQSNKNNYNKNSKDSPISENFDQLNSLMNYTGELEKTEILQILVNLLISQLRGKIEYNSQKGYRILIPLGDY